MISRNKLKKNEFWAPHVCSQHYQKFVFKIIPTFAELYLIPKFAELYLRVITKMKKCHLVESPSDFLYLLEALTEVFP